ncbi:hypothetical protein NA78x_004148 [Anatilimnocola sp. NA78]|uniref:hypothetical protein n=1 Tax=Anatilimnocola sp. NA78 TaxID=3415683 RepID=UPI003CE560CF
MTSPTVTAELPSARLHRRSWGQFSIRTMLAATLIASVLMAWVAHKRAEAAQQRRAYQIIVDKRGASNFAPVSSRSPWLCFILGEDVSGGGHCVEFGGGEFNDDDLASLVALGQIRRLSLNRTSVTDRGLIHLRTLLHLRYLSLDETQISDEGLKSLHACRCLEWLSLRDTRTTPEAVQQLRTAIPNLSIMDTGENELPALNDKP